MLMTETGCDDVDKGFLKAGNPRTLLAAFLYFDVSFMVWVLLGPLGISIAHDLHLNAGQKGLLVATPVLAGALLRVFWLVPYYVWLLVRWLIILGRGVWQLVHRYLLSRGCLLHGL